MANTDRLPLDHEGDPRPLGPAAGRLVLTREARPLGRIRGRLEPLEERAGLSQCVLQALPCPAERRGLLPPDLLVDPPVRVLAAAQAGVSARVIRW
jgi:hypothetical protein